MSYNFLLISKARLVRCMLLSKREVVQPAPTNPGWGGDKSERAALWGEEVAEIHRAAGFRDVKIEQLDLDPVPAVCVLARR